MTNWQRWHAIPLSTRWAILLWVALLLGVFGRVAWSKPGSQSVIPVYQMAGERWWNGEPLYAPPPPGMDVYRNPPGFATLWAPLSQLPPRFVALAWRLLGIGLLILGLRRFLAAICTVPLAPRSVAAVWIIAAILVLPAFNNGQVNLLLVASALLGTAAAVRARWWQASEWLMLAAWLKGYPIALAGLYVLLAPGRFLWRMPLVLAAFLIWPHFCQNSDYVWEQVHEFWDATRADERSKAPLERTPKGWTYLVRVGLGECLPPEVTQPVAVASGLMLAAVVGLAAYRNGRRPALFALVLNLALLWMVLFGPATEMNTYSILAPIGWLFVMPGSPKWSRIVSGIGIALLLIAVLRGSFPNNPDFSLASLQPLGAWILLGAGLFAALKLGPTTGTV